MKIEHEFQSHIDTFKNVNDQAIREIFEQHGEVRPQLTVLLYSNKTKQFTFAPCAVDVHFFNTEHGKDLLAEMIFPALMQEFNNKGFTIICTALSIEAWVTQLTLDKNVPMPSNAELRRLQKEAQAKHGRKEVLMTNYETEFSVVGHMMDIIRQEGNKPTLSAVYGNNAEMGGRFTGWLKKQPKLN